MSIYSLLLNRIKKKNARIGIIGLGYVGLPLALQFCKKKFNVIGFDIDKKKIGLLNKNISYINHISNKKIQNYKKSFTVTSNFKKISEVEVIILCLPTPITKNNLPDLSFIKSTLTSIKKYLITGHLIILESSTYPGSTKNTILPYLKNFKVGENFFLGYSPEREDPNNNKFKIEKIPKVCSGFTNRCLNLVAHLYKNVVKEIVKVSNIETAEFTKLYENIYRSVNIGLVNELKIISNKLNLNIYEIINAAKTKPFGFQAFYPGPGVGGHCIPVDPYYLTYVAKKKGVQTNMIYHAGKINSSMPKWIINETIKKILIKKALIIGIAYKKDVDDVRESPAIKFFNILKKKKIYVEYYDPFVKNLKSRNLDKTYKSIKLTSKKLKNYDCVFIVTDHSNIDYNQIKNNSKYIVDTRNLYKYPNKKIFKF